MDWLLTLRRDLGAVAVNGIKKRFDADALNRVWMSVEVNVNRGRTLQCVAASWQLPDGM